MTTDKQESNYLKMKRLIESSKCPTCHGLGYCDDADPGDISFNKWTCPKCQGSGWEQDFKAERDGLKEKIGRAYRQGQVDFRNRAVEVCCAQNHWEAESIANVIGDLDILPAPPKDQGNE